jgi:RES domain-containing protein
MKVYRISQTKYSNSLISLGFAGRWNSEWEGMIYTGGSASLSCLEILAHKSGAALNSGKFSLAVINIPDSILISEIELKQLQQLNVDWYQVLHYPITQKLGNHWILEMKSAVLKVPSAIVDREYNYLLNPLHPKFSKIKIMDVVPFNFDNRLKLEF